MPGRIPPEFIDRLLGRVDIVEVIDARVRLKKAGHDYMARCPFHTEKTPSFTVSPTKQFFHCFGCGAHGSAIGFLMDYERLTFHEAVEELAARAGLEVPQLAPTNAYNHSYNNATGSPSSQFSAPSPPSAAENLESSYNILAQADAWFRGQLRRHPNAQQAVAYLKGRGLTGQIAADYGLGYAPPAWDGLRQALGTDLETTQLLVKNGLLIDQAANYHDRFRNRVMFPIRDRRGRTIGFGGRVLGADKPKYLNTPETPLFHKGQELYGLFEARKALRHVERLLIVEGYMDVIALAQFGILYTVATLGTATTLAHVERLFRVCERLIFCFDGDNAGREAAWKAANVILPMAGAGREIQFLFLPDGEDPDTLVRKIGAAAFEQGLGAAKHLSDVIFDRLCTDVDTNSLDGQARVAEQARPLIGKIPPGIYRDMMTAKLEQLTGLSSNRLGIQLPSSGQVSAIANQANSRMSRADSNSNNAPLSLVDRASAILLQYPQLVALVIPQIPAHWRNLQQPDITPLTTLVDVVLQAQPGLTTAALVERWRDTAVFAKFKLLVQYNLGTANYYDPQADFLGTLQRLNTLAEHQAVPPLHSGTRPSDLTQEQKQQLRMLLARGNPAP